MTEHLNGSGYGASPSDPDPGPSSTQGDLSSREAGRTPEHDPANASEPTPWALSSWDPAPWPPPSWPEAESQQPFGGGSGSTQAYGHAPYGTATFDRGPYGTAPSSTGTSTDTGAADDTAPQPTVPATPPRRDAAPAPGRRRAGSRPSAGTGPVAGWGTRAAAGLLDAALGLVPSGALLLGGYGFAMGGAEGPGLLVMLAGYAVLLGVGLWNHVLRQGSTGQTVGKRAMGIRLVRADAGHPVGEGTAALRLLAHVLDTLPVGAGWLWPLWDAERRTFADKLCGTDVVRS